MSEREGGWEGEDEWKQVVPMYTRISLPCYF